jgi:hypothetical protein
MVCFAGKRQWMELLNMGKKGKEKLTRIEGGKQTGVRPDVGPHFYCLHVMQSYVLEIVQFKGRFAFATPGILRAEGNNLEVTNFMMYHTCLLSKETLENFVVKIGHHGFLRGPEIEAGFWSCRVGHYPS